jgi:hypothetical protein
LAVAVEVQTHLQEEVVAQVAVEGVTQEHHQVVQELQDKEMQAEEQAEHRVPLEVAVAVLVKSVNKVGQTVVLLLQVCLMVATEQALILLGVLLQVQA